MTVSSLPVGRAPVRRRRPGPSTARYGPWAVVTGASSGIGRAIAGDLAEGGFDVVLVARRRAELDELATTLAARAAVRTRVVAADLTAPAGLHAVHDQTRDLDVGLLVASAGFGTSGPLLAAQPTTERDLVAVNCQAVLDLSQHFARRFVRRGRRGGIVLLSSIVALQGVPLAANYAASKAYVHTLGEGLARELRPHGIDVLVAAPGPVDSGFGARARLNRSGMNPQEVARDTLAALGRRRLVRPGRRSKALGWPLAAAPRRLRTLVLARVVAGFAGSWAPVPATIDPSGRAVPGQVPDPLPSGRDGHEARLTSDRRPDDVAGAASDVSRAC